MRQRLIRAQIPVFSLRLRRKMKMEESSGASVASTMMTALRSNVIGASSGNTVLASGCRRRAFLMSIFARSAIRALWMLSLPRHTSKRGLSRMLAKLKQRKLFRTDSRAKLGHQTSTSLILRPLLRFSHTRCQLIHQRDIPHLLPHRTQHLEHKAMDAPGNPVRRSISPNSASLFQVRLHKQGLQGQHRRGPP